MRKKTIIPARIIIPDSKYNSPLVSQLINKLMWDGEKSKSKKIVYRAAEIIEKKIKSPFLETLTEAINNVKVGLELKGRKVGSRYQRIPVKINEKRSIILALSFIKRAVRESKEIKPAFEKLATEIIGCYNKSGTAFKYKETMLKEAESNRVLIY